MTVTGLGKAGNLQRPTLLAMIVALVLAMLADLAIGKGQPSRDPSRGIDRRAAAFDGRKDD